MKTNWLYIILMVSTIGLFIFIISAVFLALSAQQLVPNPEFTQNQGCHPSYTPWPPLGATGWEMVQGTPDFWHSDCNAMPTNLLGTHDNDSGAIGFVKVTPGGNWEEIAGTKLSDTVSGHIYLKGRAIAADSSHNGQCLCFHLGGITLKSPIIISQDRWHLFRIDTVIGLADSLKVTTCPPFAPVRNPAGHSDGYTFLGMVEVWRQTFRTLPANPIK